MQVGMRVAEKAEEVLCHSGVSRDGEMHLLLVHITF